MSLQEIYERHADFVWRTVLRLGVSEAEARDAVQDVFLAVHAHLHQFEGRSSLATWIFVICRGVARERRRRDWRSRHLIADVAAEDEIDLRADVGRAVEHNQRLALLERILRGFPVEQRNVFVLFEIEKLTGEEIAEALSIPLGTVYSRLQLARRSFRQALTRSEAQERFALVRAGGGKP